MIDIPGMWAAKKFIMPSRCQTLALSMGVGIPSIASTFAGSDLIPLGITIVLRYLTSFMHSSSLSKFSFVFRSFTHCKTWCRIFLHLSMLFAAIMRSSVPI